jgi:hypothetical protein
LCCLEKGPHWTYLLSVSSWFLTSVFRVHKESPKCDASSTCVPICASNCVKILSHVWVTTDRVWTGSRIYWTLIRLVSTLHKSLWDLLGVLSLLQFSLAIVSPSSGFLNCPQPQLWASLSNRSQWPNLSSHLTLSLIHSLHWLTNLSFL